MSTPMRLRLRFFVSFSLLLSSSLLLPSSSSSYVRMCGFESLSDLKKKSRGKSFILIFYVYFHLHIASCSSLCPPPRRWRRSPRLF